MATSSSSPRGILPPVPLTLKGLASTTQNVHNNVDSSSLGGNGGPNKARRTRRLIQVVQGAHHSSASASAQEGGGGNLAGATVHHSRASYAASVHASGAQTERAAAAAHPGIAHRRNLPSKRNLLDPAVSDSSDTTLHARQQQQIRLKKKAALMATDARVAAAQIANAAGKTLFMEAWLDSALAPGQHARNAGPIDAPEWLAATVNSSFPPPTTANDLGLSTHGLSRSQLAGCGVHADKVQDIYRGIFVHAVGFQDALRRATAGASKPRQVMASAWRAFAKVTEGAVGQAYHAPPNFLDDLDLDDPTPQEVLEQDAYDAHALGGGNQHMVSADVQEENSELMTSNDLLRDRIRELEGHVRDLTQKCSASADLAAQAKRRYQAEVRLRTEMQTRENDATVSAGIARAAEAEAIGELQTCRNVQAKLEESFGEANVSIENLSAELATAKSQIEGFEEQTAVLTERVEQTEQQRDSFAKNLADAYKQAMQDKEATRTATKERDVLQMSLDDKVEEIKRLEDELELSKSKAEGHAGRIIALQESNDALVEEREDSYREAMEARTEAETADRRWEKSQRELQGVTGDRDGLHETIDSLNERLEAAEEMHHNNLDIQDALKSELDRTRTKMCNLGVAAASIHANGSAIRAENEVFKMRIRELLGEKVMQKALMESSHTRLNNLVKQLDDATTSIGKLRDQNSELVLKNALLQNNEQSASETQKATSASLSAARESIARLEAKVAELQRTIDERDEQVRHLADRAEVAESESKVLAENLDRTCADLADSMSESELVGRVVEDELREKLTETERELERLRGDYAMVSRELHQLTAWKVSAEEEMNSHQNEKSALGDEASTMRLKFIHCQAQIDMLQTKIRSEVCHNMVTRAIAKVEREELFAEYDDMRNSADESRLAHEKEMRMRLDELRSVGDELAEMKFERDHLLESEEGAEVVLAERDSLLKKLNDAESDTAYLREQSARLGDSKTEILTLETKLEEKKRELVESEERYHVAYQDRVESDKVLFARIEEMEKEMHDEHERIKKREEELEAASHQRIKHRETEIQAMMSKLRDKTNMMGREWQAMHKESAAKLEAWRARATSISKMVGWDETLHTDDESLPPSVHETRVLGDVLVFGMHNSSLNLPIAHATSSALGGSWISALPATFVGSTTGDNDEETGGMSGRQGGYTIQSMPLPAVNFTVEDAEMIVLMLYLTKIHEDASAISTVTPSTLKTFVHEWFMSKFGDRVVGEFVLYCFAKSVLHHSSTSQRLDLFCRLCGIRGRLSSDNGSASSRLPAHCAFFVIEFLSQLVDANTGALAASYSLNDALDAITRMTESRVGNSKSGLAMRACETFRSLLGDAAKEKSISLDALLDAAAGVECELEAEGIRQIRELYASAVQDGEGEDAESSFDALRHGAYERAISIVPSLPGYRERCGLRAEDESDAPELSAAESRQLFRTALMMSSRDKSSEDSDAGVITAQGFAMATYVHGMSHGTMHSYKPRRFGEKVDASPLLIKGEWTLLQDVWASFQSEINFVLHKYAYLMSDNDDGRVSAVTAAPTVAEQLKKERCEELRYSAEGVGLLVASRHRLAEAWRLAQRSVSMYQAFMKIERKEVEALVLSEIGENESSILPP
ncbi:hypothetical protein NFJ02_31g80850 [Pycnococcus provasolii]